MITCPLWWLRCAVSAFFLFFLSPPFNQSVHYWLTHIYRNMQNYSLFCKSQSPYEVIYTFSRKTVWNPELCLFYQLNLPVVNRISASLESTSSSLSQPPLMGNVDPSKIDEIRRTVYVGNLNSQVRKPSSNLRQTFVKPSHLGLKFEFV